MLNITWFIKWGNVLILLFIVLIFTISTQIKFTTVSKFQAISINGENLIGKVNFPSQHLPTFKNVALVNEKLGERIYGISNFIKKINDTSALIYINLLQYNTAANIQRVNLLVNKRSLYDIINISNIYKKPVK